MGKNCEIDIDACALPGSSCPPGTQCLDLPDSLEYTCRVPCPQSLQVGEDLNYRSGHICSCLAVAVVCIDYSNGLALTPFLCIPFIFYYCSVIHIYLYLDTTGSNEEGSDVSSVSYCENVG